MKSILKKTKSLKQFLFINSTLITPIITIACTQNNSKTNNPTSLPEDKQIDKQKQKNNQDKSNMQDTGSKQKNLQKDRTEINESKDKDVKSPQNNYYDDTKTQQLITNKSFDELFNISPIDKSSILASKAIANTNESNFGFSRDLITIAIRDTRIKFKRINHIANDKNGTLELSFAFGDGGFVKNYTISGFQKQNVPDFLIPEAIANDKNSQKNYFNNLTTQQQYQYDWDLIKKFYPQKTTNITNAQKTQINTALAKLNIPNYDQLHSKGYTIAVNNNGKLTLQLPERPPIVISNWTDNLRHGGKLEDNTGLARTLVNQSYSDFAKQTYQMNISFYKFSSDPQQRKLLSQAFVYDIDLGELIKLLKDGATKDKIKQEFEKIKNIKEAWYVVQGEAEKQLIDDYQGQKDANNSDLSAVLYTQWIKSERQKVINKLNTINGLNENVKNRAINFVNTITDFRKLEKAEEQKEGNAGTASILDYQIPDNPNKYPTKFYFITNYHVVNGLASRDNFDISLTRLNDNGSFIGNTLKPLFYDQNFTSFKIDKEAFKVIVDGRDFLKFDPSLVANNTVANSNELVDFAIFEVDTTKIIDSYNRSAEQFAKELSNNYANLPDEKKVKIPTYDYLQKEGYQKIDAPLFVGQKDKKDVNDYDLLYIIGFPKSQNSQNGLVDFFLLEGPNAQYENEDLIKNARYSFSLWTNADRSLYKVADLENNRYAKNGGFLSTTNSLSEFMDRKGVFDRFIALPFVANKNTEKPTPQLIDSLDDNKHYYNAGLSFAVRDFNIGGGASGSPVRSKKNELIGLIDSTFFNSHVTIATALRSSGLDYQQAFGDYNLPQYDVVYGGGKDQKTSFKEKLATLYGNNIKTWLLKNGVSVTYPDYDFNKASTQGK
ncbi:putative peptidase DUF31 [Mycoplasmopsis mustelae]|uniref:Putative peptidase DUF31 n=1 Tax=Mycoplasmopsis mustelae TaxID=171289 RepID=A0A4R7UCM3_9BACT|nr:hypothetical protein [Mycoplasmopsis mustelae]TDV24129.1 putative peptidase DUF31 [Mycoplasmopsis mustelae]